MLLALSARCEIFPNPQGPSQMLPPLKDFSCQNLLLLLPSAWLVQLFPWCAILAVGGLASWLGHVFLKAVSLFLCLNTSHSTWHMLSDQ